MSSEDLERELGDQPELQEWLKDLPESDGLALRAVAVLAGRTGARQFQFNCKYPDRPFAQQSWWALAVYAGGRRLMADGHVSPQEACDALARRLLDGGQCLGCGKFSFVHCEDGYRVPDAAAAARAKREGVCRWRREGGARWARECGESAPADSTRERLAQAMAAVGVIPAGQIAAARAGRYDEYASQASPVPLMLLVEELRQYGSATAGLIEAVMAGQFDATQAESARFWESEEGRGIFAELAEDLARRGPRVAGPKPGARAGRGGSRRQRRGR